MAYAHKYEPPANTSNLQWQHLVPLQALSNLNADQDKRIHFQQNNRSNQNYPVIHELGQSTPAPANYRFLPLKWQAWEKFGSCNVGASVGCRHGIGTRNSVVCLDEAIYAVLCLPYAKSQILAHLLERICSLLSCTVFYLLQTYCFVIHIVLTECDHIFSIKKPGECVGERSNNVSARTHTHAMYAICIDIVAHSAQSNWRADENVFLSYVHSGHFEFHLGFMFA